MDSSAKTRYQCEHRLEDVLVLIQALANTPNVTGQVESAKLAGEALRLHPQSASDWADVAKEHPEFFRISGHADNAIMLICQYISREKPSGEMLGKLMDIAIMTHDREVERYQRIQERELESHKLSLTKLSLILSAVTSIGSVIVAIIALIFANKG